MKDIEGWYWEFFKPEEVLSPDGLAQLQRGVLLIQPQLLDKLGLFRALIGQPLIINNSRLKYRGYRSPKENYDIVGGEKFSFHMQGLAADISLPSPTPESTLALGEKARQFGWHGVGIYPQRGFVHVDLRPRLSERVVTWQKQ